MESDYDMPYSSDDDAGFYEEEEEYDEVESDEEASNFKANKKQKTCTVLKESDIKQRQEDEISHVCDVLFLPKTAASVLLCHYKWDFSSFGDEWFNNEEKFREAVGLLSSSIIDDDLQPVSDVKELTCGICFDSLPVDQIFPTVCGHPFCVTCWKGYVGISINDGPGCLYLRCPEPSCGAAVTQEMVDKLASDEEKQKYCRLFVRSYVEAQEKIKWCPAPGCENAVEFNLDSSKTTGYDVTCLCFHAFCWNCTEDAHRPVNCETVAKWVLKNSSESENTEWILANSKPCPRCKRPIEKNQGCMHMVCSPPCSFHFCWLCLGDWSDHGSKTGGFYACNKYDEEKKQGLHSAEEKKRTAAKNSLRRYTHYYERWAGNKKSRQKSIEDLHKIKTTGLGDLRKKVNKPETELVFIIEAWEQIIECRRVLQWTYAYGYYLLADEHAKRQLFEYLQGGAEAALERLHSCAEKEVKVFEEDNKSTGDFNLFREKLTHLTRVTRNYFDNLVTAFENNLSEVEPTVSEETGTSGAGKDMDD